MRFLQACHSELYTCGRPSPDSNLRSLRVNQLPRMFKEANVTQGGHSLRLASLNDVALLTHSVRTGIRTPIAGRRLLTAQYERGQSSVTHASAGPFAAKSVRPAPSALEAIFPR